MRNLTQDSLTFCTRNHTYGNDIMDMAESYISLLIFLNNLFDDGNTPFAFDDDDHI